MTDHGGRDAEHGDEPLEEGRVLDRRTFSRKAAIAGPAVLGAAVLTSMLGPQAADAATGVWNLAGNAGTAPATNFVGTTDNQPLVLRTNKVERARILATGNVGINITAPTAKLHAKATTGTAGHFDALATGATGVFGSAAANGNGVLGTAKGTGHGVVGINSDTGGTGGSFAGHRVGVAASASDPDGFAVQVRNSFGAGTRGVGVQGMSGSGTADRVHPGGTFYDAAGEFSGPNGVIGAASSDAPSGYGVIGLANNAAGVGVYASGSGGATALLTIGNADIFGTLTKSGGSFKIDHPLRPTEQYLSHSFVESSDMKNIYDGVVVADAEGRATVTLPDWYEALNRDERYQLTAIGGPAPDLHVAEKLKRGKFTIAGARAGQEVSWQLTGIRQDAWANANRIPVEHDKSAADKGRFIHPELFGAPADARVGNHQIGRDRTRS